MPKKPTPRWQPISQLPLLAVAIDGMLESAEETYQSLQQARPKPHVLDDYTVGRVIKVHTAQQNDLGLYDEQLQRWKKQTLTDTQRQEVDRLTVQVGRLRQVITAILTLADELKAGTIEQVLGKSDVEVGLEFLLRRQGKE